VAFLRGINVGGHRVSKERFQELFAEMGWAGAVTFRASGNVIFDAEEGEGEAAMTNRIEQHLEKALGYAVPAFVRSAAEVRAIAAYEPFEPGTVAASAGKLQVGLLRVAPSASASRNVLALATGDDRLAIHARELYWLPSGGLLESELDLNAIDAELGATTRRTMGTMEQIATKKLGD
jgi:uncharacterized protein (DUF1697 family)